MHHESQEQPILKWLYVAMFSVKENHFVSSFNSRYNVIVASKMQALLKLGCAWARAEPDHSCDPFNRHITLISREIVKSFTFLKVFVSASCFKFIKTSMFNDCHFRCAYLVGNVQEYITLSLELMGRCILSNMPVSEESLPNVTLILH